MTVGAYAFVQRWETILPLTSSVTTFLSNSKTIVQLTDSVKYAGSLKYRVAEQFAMGSNPSTSNIFYFLMSEMLWYNILSRSSTIECSTPDLRKNIFLFFLVIMYWKLNSIHKQFEYQYPKYSMPLLSIYSY